MVKTFKNIFIRTSLQKEIYIILKKHIILSLSNYYYYLCRKTKI